MTPRELTLSILRYETTRPIPVVHFGYWGDTLAKWAGEGHLTAEEARGFSDGGPMDVQIARKLGFDFNYFTVFNFRTPLLPPFPTEVVEELPDGSRKIRDGNGTVVLQKPGAGSIPMDFDHLLKDRASWEEHFLPRLQYSPERFVKAPVLRGEEIVPFGAGGREYLVEDTRENLYGLYCGSLLGEIRNWIGLEDLCYLQVDDPGLFREIVEVNAGMWLETVRAILETGARFDFAHFWEDICFKNGPLISPALFAEVVGPHYRRITELVAGYGIDLVSLDCDGKIDALIPTWLENGVNTMFPIEVGTWDANIAPWREKYGRQIRGVGGMNKTIFARDRAAVDGEIERLKPLVDLGGYIPCPDHRIAPDAEWDNVRYYCDRMHEEFA